MKTITEQLLAFIFISFCITNAAQAYIPATHTNIITHRSSKNFLNKLFKQQWIGAHNVQPLITILITTLNDATKAEHEKKQAIEAFKGELYKIIATVQHNPKWLTFEAIENLEQNHVFCGFSKGELTVILKVAGVFATGWLLREYIRAQFNKHVKTPINTTTDKAIEKVYGPIARYIKNDLPSDAAKVLAEGIKAVGKETFDSPEFKDNLKEVIRDAVKTAVDEFHTEENQAKTKEHIEKVKAGIFGETPEEKAAFKKEIKEFGTALGDGLAESLDKNDTVKKAGDDIVNGTVQGLTVTLPTKILAGNPITNNPATRYVYDKTKNAYRYCFGTRPPVPAAEQP